MIDPAHVPPVEAEELLARSIVQRSHVRSDQTVKPDAFVPHPHLDLSVTRHYSATEAEIWAVGEDVAAKRQKTLYGRADVLATALIGHRLQITAAPVEGNPNHANVSSWPGDKPAQKIIAQEIAAQAHFVPVSDKANNESR